MRLPPKLGNLPVWTIIVVALCLGVRPCGALPAAPVTATPKTASLGKVILDTDIADDIDDAYALALLATTPGVKLRYRKTFASARSPATSWTCEKYEDHQCR